MSLEEIVRCAEPAHAVPPAGDGSRELLDEITARPRPAARPRRDRWRLAVPLTVALAAAAVLAGWLLPLGPALGPRPAAALDIRREGGFYIVTVKDAFAAPERYAAQLRARGLDIGLSVQPVSPSMEGMIFTPYDPRLNGVPEQERSRRPDAIVPIARPGACATADRCVIGVRIPVDYRAYKGPDYTGPAMISLGRRARPGERHRGFARLSTPGEPLACRAFIGRTVDQVTAMLRRRGVTVGVFAVPQKGSHPSVPGTWRVHDGWLTEPGKALLVADPAPPPRVPPLVDCP
ncbi:hypothetical protein GCM10009678_20220 [Actinomadura kijaniata]|uniref:PASTA domain-containing protein n=1 Tax=Actinomadura namibiensis TaxID=182080 RepID=A0A7W3QJ02_ACTNM|nr:hypothetical protein [Actinomadura namibiensis]MBA8949004.1 hypothetical protein [Actinomadura namibiensis]